MGYNRPGTSDFTGAIAANPGVSLSANRSPRSATSGTPGSIFLRNTADVGPPANMPITRVYPMTDVITGDITVFEPGLQVPYAMTWTGGWQRKVGSSMVVEARYVGSRSLQSWQTYNYNEINIVENGFLNEFRVAQANLEANIAAGRGNTFAYTGAPGPSPLPIFLAHFNAAAGVGAGNTGELHRHELDQHHVPRIPREVQPDAVQLRQHRHRPPDRQRHVPQQRAHGRPARRTSSRPIRT